MILNAHRCSKRSVHNATCDKHVLCNFCVVYCAFFNISQMSHSMHLK